MLGNIIITAPNNVPTMRKIRIFVNGENKGDLKKNENIKIELEKNSTVVAQVVAPAKGGPLCPSVSVSAANSTKININYSLFLDRVTLDITDTKKVCDCSGEETVEMPICIFDGGVKDSILLYEDYLVIKHKGALNAVSMGIKGEKNIYYSDITSVQYKRPGFSSGYIQISLPGGIESKGGVLSAMSDENTVAVKSGDALIETKAQEVVDIINKKIKEIKSNKNKTPIIAQQISSADELKKFKELLDMGVITEEEFNSKKKELLGF